MKTLTFGAFFFGKYVYETLERNKVIEHMCGVISHMCRDTHVLVVILYERIQFSFPFFPT